MRLGVLGGTFNPIHCAHVEMAVCAKRELSLDLVLMMVAADPPHKQVGDNVSALDRLEMVRLAVADLDGIEACELELHRTGKSYTYDTILALRELYPDAELYLIVGGDTMQEFPGWYRPREILSLCELACVPRLGYTQQDASAAKRLRDEFHARLTMLSAAAQELSSTEVRQRVHEAKPIDSLVHGEVEAYIYANGLYFSPELHEQLLLLKESLPQKRFRHSVGVMLKSVQLARLWGADATKARLAGLLHDCAKYLPKEELDALSKEALGVDAVRHAFAGARLARERYGVDDAEVLRAIRLHCTGDQDMRLLDKVVYLADITERYRDFDGVEAVRATLKHGPDYAMLYALQRNKDCLEAGRGEIHPASQRALEYFIEKEGGSTMVTREQVMGLCEVLYHKKAQDILAIHVAEKTVLADWFIIASGNVPSTTKMLSDELNEKAEELGLTLQRKEGYNEGRWIVEDYGDILVHLFIPDERKFYNMERLWDEDSTAIRYSRQRDEEEAKKRIDL